MSVPKLILGTYNHMPFGSREEEFEGAYQSAFRPFIASLYKYPSVPMTLHFSGPLLEWFERRHPEFLIILEELVDRKQVELLGGGYYEPMLPLLPLADRIGQIEQLTTFLRKHFGKRPRGCWLPGRMWEPNLAGALQTCGMDYTFLEDSQFVLSGLSGADAERPCVTEDQGKTVVVFPASEDLAGHFSSMDIGSILSAARAGRNSDDRTLVALCDGRDFVKDGREFDEHSFCSMLSTIAAAEGELELTTPGRSLKAAKPRQKAFFTCGAERRVCYWSMDEKRQAAFDALSRRQRKELAPFLAGGFPRQFLSRYLEANGIYSKMMYVHILINQLRGDKYRKRASREELWKAQGCDAFWHLGDGGIYQNWLRKTAYRSLIDAERITRERGVFIPSVLTLDFDLDGEREYLFQGSELNAYVHLQGGLLFELDSIAGAWNYLDTFTRRAEPYHEPGAQLDGYRRAAFVDHLLRPDPALPELGATSGSRNCAFERYEDLKLDRVHHELSLRCPASSQGPYGGIEILKKYSVKKNELKVRYELVNQGSTPERFDFAPEINLSMNVDVEGSHPMTFLRSGAEEDRALFEGEGRGIDALRLRDAAGDSSVSLLSSSAFDVFIRVVRSDCAVGGRMDRIYQSTCIVPVRPVVLAPGESWETEFALRLEN